MPSWRLGLLMAIITGGIDLSVGSILAVAMCSHGDPGSQDGGEPLPFHVDLPGGRCVYRLDEWYSADQAASTASIHRHPGYDEHCPWSGVDHHRSFSYLRF